VQISVVLLGCALTAGAGALAFGDYSSFPPETASALALSSHYLTDNNASSEAVRLRIDKIGYPTATTVFLPALARDPASSTHWIDLGDALQATGDPARAQYCYLRAEAVAPNDPLTLLAIADYFRTLKNPPRAAPYFSRVLALSEHDEDAIMIQNIFNYLELMHVRELHLLDSAIPNTGKAHQYLTWLMAQTDPAIVRATWHWMHSRHFDDDPGTVEYVRYLVAKSDYPNASADWGLHEAASHDGYPTSTLVFNGGFEYPSTGSPFDWDFDGVQGLAAERDTTVVHDGRYSMRIDITRNDNLDFRNFRQTVVLPPGRYRLDGFLRTADVTGAEGFHLRVQGLQSGVLLAETDGLAGTHDWTPVSATFDVPAASSIAQIQLVRHFALRIDNQLTGKVWLDSIRLARVH
jgi:tetratricopeptide (TPR) repeat protein